jgi:hypothetical protein
MKLECIATVLNIRTEPEGKIIGELRFGDVFDVPGSKAIDEWVLGTVINGVSAGKRGYVRRKWLIQYFDSPPTISTSDRTVAAQIVAQRTTEFDAIHYDLGSKAKTWKELKENGYVDCSGWVYLLGKEILREYKLKTDAKELYTYSDEQITNCGKLSKVIISGKYIQPDMFLPGVLVGIDFAEYSWDRGRPLDIDHIMIIGEDHDGLFVSQSSSSGAGVNKVPLLKWFASQQPLIAAGKIHLVDILSMP